MNITASMPGVVGAEPHQWLIQCAPEGPDYLFFNFQKDN